MSMFDFLAPLAVGFMGSVHCLGMCGPLVVAYSLYVQSPRSSSRPEFIALWRGGISHHIAFHVGRIMTYGVLGAAAAGLAHLVTLKPFFAGLRSTVSLGGGIVMVLFGLFLLRVVPFPGFAGSISGSYFQRFFQPLLSSPRWISRVALGLGTGFLPCLLSWAMIAKAATTATLWGGFMTMVLFGLGTVPALFFTGLSASLFSLKVRFIGERVAALSVVAMGLILVFKGAKFFV
jgi:uncharacterized protein